ncbi:MAG: sugar transporter STL1 [Lasallia pustulata]|uniref:Sugar transporter STL1 n=1 Tax=Lasallia pustulata TaxID=136370 RepID=A0A5M8PFT2_9LECA|nr:MAG: sugar transporter STL1 [Lasallia pustulata]
MDELSGRALMGAVTGLTSLGFCMIGYDNGLMGGLINTPSFLKTFHTPGANVTATIVAIFDAGAFLGAVATSIFAEKLGRRKTVAVGVLLMILGALLQATAYMRAHIIVARVVSGMGMGVINSTVPVFQSEFSPKAKRGLYVCMQLSTLNFGIFLVYWIDYAFSTTTSSYAWRVPVILQCVFLLAMLILIFIVPETPRWLAAHDRSDESLAVLRRLRAHQLDDATILGIHSDILRAVAEEQAIGSGSWKTLLKADRIHNYSTTLFFSAGLTSHLSALMSGFLQLWFFLASFIPWALIDRVGRRPLFLSTITLMALTMAAQAALVYRVQHPSSPSAAHAASIAACAMLFLFEGLFTVGFQATVWVYPTEILPLRLRQKGSAISTGANWIFNFTVVEASPVMLERIGWRTYVVFAVLNATWVPIIYVFFPESKGRELEDFDRLFAGEAEAGGEVEGAGEDGGMGIGHGDEDGGKFA